MRWFFAVSLFIAPAAFAESVPEVVSVEVPNAGFEAAELAPWEAYGDVVEVINDDCAAGNACLRLGIAAGAPNNEAGIYQDVAVVSPRSLRVSAGIAVDEALTGDTIVELKLELPGSEDYVWTEVHSGATPVGAWDKPVLCIDVTGDQALARPVVLVRSPTGTGTGVVRVDAIELMASISPCNAGASDDDGGCAGGALGFAPASLLLFFCRSRRVSR